MEVLAETAPEHEIGTRAFLASFQNLAITPAVAETAVSLRKIRRLKLPDAIFPAGDAGVRIPYRC